MKCFIIFFYTLIIILLTSVITCAVDKKSDINLVIKNEKREDGKKAVTAVFVLKADPELVYATLRDVEKFPEFMPGSADVEILEKGDSYQIVKFSGSRGLFSADIVMKRIIDDKNKRIEWCLVDGPPREVSGYWYVEKDKKNGSVLVHYSNHVNAGMLIPGFMVRKILFEDIQKMVPNILKRVKSGGTWMSEEYLEKIKDGKTLKKALSQNIME